MVNDNDEELNLFRNTENKIKVEDENPENIPDLPKELKFNDSILISEDEVP